MHQQVNKVLPVVLEERAMCHGQRLDPLFADGQIVLVKGDTEAQGVKAVSELADRD